MEAQRGWGVAAIAAVSVLVTLLVAGKVNVSIQLGDATRVVSGGGLPLPAPSPLTDSSIREPADAPAATNGRGRVARAPRDAESITVDSHSGLERGRRNLPPILLATADCGQSSISIKLMRALVEAAGYPVAKVKDEALNKRDKQPAGGVKALLDNANQRGETLVLKLMRGKRKLTDALKDNIKLMMADNARVVTIIRGNVLDRHVCRVRDCFAGRQEGKSVDENGIEADVCFERRKMEKNKEREIKLKAHLNVHGLLDRLKFLKQAAESLQRWAKEVTNQEEVEVFTTEELTSFETAGASVDEINACFEKWVRVLRAVGVPANMTIVATTLRGTELVGTRPAKPHTDTIYNAHEVADVLEKTSKQNPWMSDLYRKTQTEPVDDPG